MYKFDRRFPPPPCAEGVPAFRPPGHRKTRTPSGPPPAARPRTTPAARGNPPDKNPSCRVGGRTQSSVFLRSPYEKKLGFCFLKRLGIGQTQFFEKFLPPPRII